MVSIRGPNCSKQTGGHLVFGKCLGEFIHVIAVFQPILDLGDGFSPGNPSRWPFRVHNVSEVRELMGETTSTSGLLFKSIWLSRFISLRSGIEGEGRV